VVYDPVHPLECSCGVAIDRCPFWTKVFVRLGRAPESLSLRLRFLKKEDNSSGGQQLFRQFPRRLFSRNPQLFLSPLASTIVNATRVATDSFDLYNAVLHETGADYLIDSSKDAFRFRALYNRKPDRMLGILLGRDYRGTVNSKLKRGRDLKKSATTWVTRMTQMKVMTSGIPPEQLIRVRYEDLCQDPRAELARVCEFMNIDFSDVMMTRPSTGVHHLGGSPSKFDPARKKIDLDQSYLDAFDDNDLEIMREIVGEVASEWGYT